MTDEYNIDLDPDKEIINPYFEDGDGVAICAKWTGYGANKMGPEMILAKSATEADIQELRKAFRQVRVELSFVEFLTKFMNMYSYDAKILATMLGYEIENEGWEDMEYQKSIEDKASQVTLLKSMKTEEDFLKLSVEDQDALTALQAKFEKALYSGTFSENKVEKSTVEVSTIINDENNSENGEEKVSEDTSKYDEILNKMAAQNKEFEATLEKERLKYEELKDKLLDKEKDAVLAKSAGMDFIGEEEKALLKGLDVSAMASVMDILTKAQAKVKELEGKIDEVRKEATENDYMMKALSAAGEADDANASKESGIVAHLRKMNQYEDEAK